MSAAEEDGRKKTGSRRAFAWALLLFALSGGLGFFVAKGDVDLVRTFELEEALTSVRQSFGELEERLSPAPALLENPDKEALLARISDLETRIALDAALAGEPLLHGTDVRAEVAGGTVTLTGSVATAAQRETAERIAALLAGEVTNRLLVGDSADGGRTELARRVEFELFVTEAFDLDTLEVTAEGGVVTLRGTVRSTAERLLAVRIAGELPGVSEVADELRVGSRLDERDPGERE